MAVTLAKLTSDQWQYGVTFKPARLATGQSQQLRRQHWRHAGHAVADRHRPAHRWRHRDSSADPAQSAAQDSRHHSTDSRRKVCGCGNACSLHHHRLQIDVQTLATDADLASRQGAPKEGNKGALTGQQIGRDHQATALRAWHSRSRCEWCPASYHLAATSRPQPLQHLSSLSKLVKGCGRSSGYVAGADRARMGKWR